MISELNLSFQNSQQVTIRFAQYPPVNVDFTIPLTAQDKEAIRHYLEVYATQYVMDIDDQEAKRVTAQLPRWGQALFDAIFNNTSAKQLFTQFINTSSDKYLVTITAQQPEILSLPWELLHNAGQFLFAFQPSITILRRIPLLQTQFPAYVPQSHLHILFVISRPQGVSFIDPRTDAQAVLKAIENYSAITVEFLQPATLENLWQRLQNSGLQRVDVIHFDGHGIFDKTGKLSEKGNLSKQLGGHFPRDLRKKLRNLRIGANTGYLLFEQASKYGKNGRDQFYVPTSWLAYLLSESKVRLIVLSACQSAMVRHDNDETDEDPIGSTAVGLVTTSVPSVLAMSYSVMVRVTELLFGEFYREIAQGNSVGMALDKARQALFQDKKRRDLQRGQERVEIQVSDWFLPTLYQAGEDTPLLTSRMTPTSPKSHQHNLSQLSEVGFWGRRKKLWQIENWFVDGVRRVVVSGFSGQGKTFLAQKLGRWLLQKAMFDAVVFVDYSGYQGLDAVQWAVTTLGSVIGQSLIDVAAADVVLQNQRILLILDNLEGYATEKKDTLQELLTIAQQWSLLGKTRVLITTRPLVLEHEAYPVRDENADFRRLVLAGLNKEDALHYFERLLVLLNKSVRLQTDELLHWFAKVQFHPLSISWLAHSLETEDLASLETRLNQLMLELPNNPVEATLQLVIEQLDEESRRLLPRLGMFQGGAMENILLGVTELRKFEESSSIKEIRKSIQAKQSDNPQEVIESFGLKMESLSQAFINSLCREVKEDRKFKFLIEKFSGFPEPGLAQGVNELTWSTLRWQLASIGLIQVKDIAGQTYIQFHPNLAYFLRLKLSSTDKAKLTVRYQQYYYQLSNQLESDDTKNPAETRAILRWELPNLLYAAYEVLAVGIVWAVEFGNNVSRFLDIFGLSREKTVLTQLIKRTKGKKDFDAFYLVDISQAKQLLNQERYQQAEQLFHHLLRKVKKSSYEHSAVLTHLGNCLEKQGQLIQAEKSYRDGLLIVEQLKTSRSVRRQTGILQANLANVLMKKGDYKHSYTIYNTALDIAKEQNDIRQITVIKGQLGSLAFLEGKLQEAQSYHDDTLSTAQRLNEPEMEATAWYQLGLVYQKQGNLNDAEEAYRKAALIQEQLENTTIVETWNSLGTVLHATGKFEEAKAWYQKALAYSQAINSENYLLISNILNNLAECLKNNFQSLEEAQQLAEEALALKKKKIDPSLAQLWGTYMLLAKIAEQQNQPVQAKCYRYLAIEAKANSFRTQYELQKFNGLITTVIDYVAKPKQQKTVLHLMKKNELPEKLITIFQKIFDGERDLDNLCKKNLEFSTIIYFILERLKNKVTLG
ncbi:MAG: tetratricopeptide repeat protein [Thioploca sp.]|nr:tetratricopeptide repeat protein [Thioploca sp.]